jgi:hypothetical protein
MTGIECHSWILSPVTYTANHTGTHTIVTQRLQPWMRGGGHPEHLTPGATLSVPPTRALEPPNSSEPKLLPSVTGHRPRACRVGMALSGGERGLGQEEGE